MVQVWYDTGGDAPSFLSFTVYRNRLARYGGTQPVTWFRLSPIEYAALGELVSSSGVQYTFGDDQLPGNRPVCCDGAHVGISLKRPQGNIDGASFASIHWFSIGGYLPPDAVALVRLVNRLGEEYLGSSYWPISEN